MRVGIFTEGGGGMGFGHLTRCASLESAFLDAGDEVEVVIHGPGTTGALFRTKRLSHADWTSDSVRTAEAVKRNQAVVFDSYFPTDSFYRDALHGFNGISVFFDDTNRITYPSGMVINGAINAADLYSDVRPNLERCLGPQWQPIRDPFRRQKPRVIRQEIQTALVTLGGDDIRSLVPELYRELTGRFPTWKWTFIATSYSRTVSRLRELVCAPHRLLVDINAHTMAEEMALADVAVTAAGQTTFETAVCGLPSVMIEVADNQRALAESWVASGVVLQTFSWDTPRLMEQLANAIESLSATDQRLFLSRQGQAIVDGNGAARIARRIRERIANGQD